MKRRLCCLCCIQTPFPRTLLRIHHQVDELGASFWGIFQIRVSLNFGWPRREPRLPPSRWQDLVGYHHWCSRPHWPQTVCRSPADKSTLQIKKWGQDKHMIFSFCQVCLFSKANPFSLCKMSCQSLTFILFSSRNSSFTSVYQQKIRITFAVEAWIASAARLASLTIVSLWTVSMKSRQTPFPWISSWNTWKQWGKKIKK